MGWKKKKHPKKKKTGKHKKTVKKGNRKNITTNKKHPGKKDVVPDQDEEPAPTMKSYSEDNDTDRKRMGDGADDNAQSDNEQNSTAPEQTQQPTQRVTSLIKQIQLSRSLYIKMTVMEIRLPLVYPAQNQKKYKI